MTQKHTPGLLVAVRNSAYWQVDPAQDRGEGALPYTVADVCASDPGNETGLQEANARRVAAAWNACEGIPTDALDAGVVAQMLGSLQLALPFVRNDNAAKVIRAAIARATGAA